jgi:hypothetical protein
MRSRAGLIHMLDLRSTEAVMLKHLQALTPFAFLPVLVFAEQGTARDKSPEPVLAVVQTDASRPGDELLDCEGLARELISSMSDPAVQSHLAKNGTKKQLQLSVISSSSRNTNVPQAKTTQLATRNLQREVRQMNELLTIAPQLMRGQRVLNLAQARQCKWLQAAEAEPSTGHEAGH